MKENEFRLIIRLGGSDLDGNKPVIVSLNKIKGISFSFANAICNVLGIDKKMKTGDLTDEQIAEIEKILKDPLKHKFPVWMVNLRKDLFTGKDQHITGPDVSVYKSQTQKLWQKLKTYRGLRLSKGLPVRGQRTRSHFRKTGKKLGVKKKAKR
jgi:small subunit ribosomal protein S13